MKNVVRTADGSEILSFKTKRLGVTVKRQCYTSGGKTHFVKRFHFAKMVNGELMRFALSAVPAEAQATADQIAAFLMDPRHTLADARKQFNPGALLRPNDFSTVGDLFEFHKEHWRALRLSDRAAEGYQRGLMLIMRYVDAERRGVECENWSGMRKGKEERHAPWLAKPLTILNARLGLDYQKLMVPPDLEDQEEIMTQEITCDTTFRGAKHLFTKDALLLYKRTNKLTLPLENIEDFKSVKLFGTVKYFVLPEPDVILNIFREAPVLKAKDLNAYRALLVCSQVGFRKTEAANFRIPWMREENTPVVLVHEDGTFKPKHGHGRKVRIEGWVAQEIRELAGDREYFMDGNHSERTDWAFERLNAWLRERGVNAQKPTHELRKLWFSQKVAREDVFSAAQQGGHRDVKITQSFYADNAMTDKLLPFWIKPTLLALASA